MSKIAAFTNVATNNACSEAREKLVHAIKFVERMAKDKQCDADDRHAIQLNLSHLRSALERL